MNHKRYTTAAILLAAFMLLAVTPAWSAGPAQGTDATDAATGDENTKAPKVFFPKTAYKFDPVMDGTQVSHTFVVKNQGEAPLNINKVKTG